MTVLKFHSFKVKFFFMNKFHKKEQENKNMNPFQVGIYWKTRC